jgi:glycosyltransferase involved in cell wall biosynthesis
MSGRLLTVAIQTYNRGEKAERVVRRFIDLIQQEHLENEVEIHVSDNASPDDTEQRLRPLASSKPVFVRYTRQPVNVQFDGNTAFLYDSLNTDYMWLFGDDDIPFRGALTKIVAALRASSPDLLLFSFAQPPDTPHRTFDFPDDITVVRKEFDQALLVVKYTKLSIFVYRRINLSMESQQVLARYADSGWWYIGLAYCILLQRHPATAMVISEALAGSDADWARVAYSPKPYLTLGEAVAHPFVRRYAPSMVLRYRRGGYLTAVSWCLQARLGYLSPERPEEFVEFFRRELPLKPLFLLSSPRAALAYFLLWSGLWRLLPSARRQHSGK